VSAPIDLVILGSTGSIGVQALEIVGANPDKFRVIGLSAGSKNLELLAEQANKFSVPVVGTTGNRETLVSKLGKTQVIDGPTAASEIAAMTCGVVLNGISGKKIGKVILKIVREKLNF